MLLVVDLSGLVHRAWHGRPHAAARITLGWVAGLLDQLGPTHVAACVDRPWPTWRHDLARESGAVYKPPEKRTGGADRASILGHLRVAEELCEDVLGVRVFGARGFEGDDLVATFTAWYPGDVIVAARDKDFCQLVSERVTLVDFATGERTRPEDVEARYGVPPARFCDYLALVGDKTDGYPGCPGIGPSAARELIGKFPDVEAMLEDARNCLPNGRIQTRRRRLFTGADALRLSLRLATLRTDAPLRDLRGVDDLRALPVPDGLL
jgi:DNA polymerase-1